MAQIGLGMDFARQKQGQTAKGRPGHIGSLGQSIDRQSPCRKRTSLLCRHGRLRSIGSSFETLERFEKTGGRRRSTRWQCRGHDGDYRGSTHCPANASTGIGKPGIGWWWCLNSTVSALVAFFLAFCFTMGDRCFSI